jgi:Domain of unknown function (DUF4386)
MTSRNTARLAGFFWFLTGATGAFSIVYTRNKLVTFSDSSATFQNLQAQEQLFRESIAAGILLTVFTLIFGFLIFEFFSKASPRLSRFFLAAILLAACIGAVNVTNSSTALLITSNASYLHTFQPEQLSALMMIYLRSNNSQLGVQEIFTGMYLFSLGLLIFQTRSLPRVLGVLLMIGACAFPVNTFSKILAPGFHAAQFTSLTMILNALGSPISIFWLMIAGAREPTTEPSTPSAPSLRQPAAAR